MIFFVAQFCFRLFSHLEVFVGDQLGGVHDELHRVPDGAPKAAAPKRRALGGGPGRGRAAASLPFLQLTPGPPQL